MQFDLTNNTQPEKEIEWVSFGASLKEVGDTFTITATRMSFKAEEGKTPCFYVFDETNPDHSVGMSVFCENHPDSPYPNATPHGVRLARAIGRHFELTGKLDGQDICDAINAATEPVVHIEKTDKGVLWTIQA